MTAIVILNWNGYHDTIECLDSLYAMSSDFYVVVVDNGSADNSVVEIKRHLSDRNIKMRSVEYGSGLYTAPDNRECIIYTMEANLGFAKGNNEALRLLRGYLPAHILLLNNDTIVEPDFLGRLTDFSEKHHEIEVFTPLICFNSDRNKIWNCGGILFLGLRKYYYANQTLQQIKEAEFIRVSFLTGCALFFSPLLLNEDGGIFTEDFFFGEEDFNFCLRMNQEKRRMACVLTSKIYHKVGSSIKKDSSIGKTYIYYLNRFIDVRRNTSCLKYRLWSLIYSFYVMMLLLKQGFSFIDSYILQRQVLANAERKDRVTQTDFMNALAARRAEEL